MIKKIGFLLIAGVLLLSLVSVNGCGSTSSTASNPKTPQETLATSVVTASSATTSTDNTTSGAVTGLSIISGSTVKTSGFSTTADSDGFWSYTYSASGISYDYKIKIYNLSGAAVTTYSALLSLTSTQISAIDIFCIGTYTATDPNYSYKLGLSTSNPLKITNVQSTTNEVANGPVYYSEASTTYNYDYNITLTYVDMNINGTYPNGTENFTGTYTEAGTSTTVAGYVTYNGTATATIVFTSGYSGTYYVNLDTGAVTAASI